MSKQKVVTIRFKFTYKSEISVDGKGTMESTYTEQGNIADVVKSWVWQAMMKDISGINIIKKLISIEAIETTIKDAL